MKPDLPLSFQPETAAEAYAGTLASRGVEYLFANGGTDFAPIVEAYAKGQARGWKLPQPVIVPHENMGIAMMHGYTMVSGRAQEMMVHVGMGTANCVNGVINAARQAGATQATTDTRTRTKADISKVRGSRGLPPAHAPTTRLSTTLSPSPTTTPAASITAVELITNRRMLLRGAPRAIRMPTSWVRCVTAKETTL